MSSRRSGRARRRRISSRAPRRCTIFLPCLIPPIDRQYTSRFFTGQKVIPSGEHAFPEWFRYFVEIGQRCRTHIDVVITRGGLMATGPAKVIDNAIVGFMQAKDSRSSRGPDPARELE